MNKIIESVNSADGEYQALMHEAEALISRGRCKEAESMAPQIQDARDKLHQVRNQAAEGLSWDPFDINEVPMSELWATAASHLSGRSCTVELFGQTKYIGSMGECRLSPGKAHIVISDEITTVDSRFTTLLHETVHARFGDVGQDEAQERRAIDQAHEWDRFATKNCYSVGTRKQSIVERKLRACLLIKV